MKLIDFNIPNFGQIKGRDAINILETKCSNPLKFEVIVSVFDSSTNKSNTTDKLKYLKIIFLGVILYKIFDENIRGILTEKEFEMYSESDTETVFMEIENSDLVQKNNEISKGKNLRHLVLETYDYKIECLCENVTVCETTFPDVYSTPH